MSDLVFCRAMDAVIYVKNIIDNYWKKEMDEKQLFIEIERVFSIPDNRVYFIRGSAFTPVANTKLGKNRINELKRILLLIDSVKYYNVV